VTGPEPVGWTLTENDQDLLHHLAYALRSFTDFAETGQDLIAIGEAVQAIELLLEGQLPEVIIGLDIGYRAGDANAAEGFFSGFRIDQHEIILDVTRTTYSSDIGSDWETERYAVLRPRGRFPEDGVHRWTDELEAVLASGNPKLQASRDHV
jgi:hypothetical protein